ncbi:MAG TPA: ABC transporter permease subunit [Acetobacteraceae bacterium]|nr:ABC transporter permease subunit [Acetobacteraceae bacterium]
MTWDDFTLAFLSLDILWQAWPILLSGLVQTVLLSLIVVPLGLGGGVLLALLSTVRSPWVRWPLMAWVDVFRSLPPLVLLVFVYAGLPFAGVEVSAWGAVAIGFFLNTGAYYGEILRAGIESVPAGQTEAARSTGLSRGQAMAWVVLPQGGAERAAGPHLQHLGGGEAHLHRFRGGAAGIAVSGAASAERDLQCHADRGGGRGLLRAAVAGGAAVEPAGEPATGGAGVAPAPPHRTA